MKQLTLTEPVPIRVAIARELARILARAERDAAELRKRGQDARADELLKNRRHLVETMQSAAEHAVDGRRGR